jgi:uncharacterized membrane protein
MGRFGYLWAYVGLSTVTFAWLILAVLRAPYVGLWALRPWQVHVTLVLVALAAVLLVAALLTPNPLSLSLRTAGTAIPNDAILGVTRHPLLWAFGLWSLSHVLVNGDVASVMLFGMLTVFALGYIPLLDRRMKKILGIEEWRRLSAGSSNMLFAGYFGGNVRPRIDRRLIFSIIGGLAFFILLLLLHRPIIGVNPLGVII